MNWIIDAADRIKKTDASKLQDEYAKLVEGLQEAADAEDAFVSNPGKVPFDRARTPWRSSQKLYLRPVIVLPEDLLKEAIPGNIRKAEHFVAFLKRFVEYLKVRVQFYHSSDAMPYCVSVAIDTYARASRRCRDASLVLTAPQGHYVHRAATITVCGGWSARNMRSEHFRQLLRGAPAVPCADFGAQPCGRVLVPAEGRKFRHSSRNVRER